MNEDTRLEDEYPLPWTFEEMWSGSGITAANGKRVVIIRKGTSFRSITAEHLLAEWIVRCVNESGSAVIAQWWAELPEVQA